MKKDRTALRSYFFTNNIPTQDNFYDFIDSGINQVEDGIKKDAGSPIGIQAAGAGDGTQDLLFFYKNFNDPNPSWRVNQNPRTDPNDPGTGKSGLNISDAAGASRLFIKNDDGSVGIGTITPLGKLHVKQGNVLVEGGNVGIGTTTPGFPLTFANALGDKISLFGQSGASFGFGIQPALLQIHTNEAASDTAFGYGSSAGFAETMRIKGNGRVGIGTATPSASLSFSNSLGDKISLWGQSVNTYGFGIQGSLLQIHTDEASSDVAFGSGSSAGFNETMRVKGNGNVGIGTNAPQAKLQVVGGAIQPAAGNSTAAGIQFPNNIGNGGGDGAWMRYYVRAGSQESTTLEIGTSNDWDDHIALIASGNVGVATVTPRQKLHVEGSMLVTGTLGIGTSTTADINEGSRITGKGALAIKGDSPQLDFIDTSNNQWAIHVNDNRLYFIREPWNYSDLVLDGKGNVGIGTFTPGAKLHVVGSQVMTSLNYTFLHNAPDRIGGPGTWSGVPVSIWASDRVIATEFNAFSDVRIKTNVQKTDGAQDLLNLSKLEIKDYEYIDFVQRGNVENKGFIAQEVEKIIPQAVSKHADFIPDIYSSPINVELVDGILSVTMKEAHKLNDGDMLRLITPNGNQEVSVKVVSETVFTVTGWKEETTEVFVYGKEVKDFRTLNYDHLFTIGISAIQELYKQMQQLKDELLMVKGKLMASWLPSTSNL